MRMLTSFAFLALLASFSFACVKQVGRIQVPATPAPASREVTDDLGRRVAIRGIPARVVALSPSLVEILFALDVTPVGRPSNARYPEVAKQVLDIGAPHNLNYERISDLKPDLIIGSVGTSGSQLAQLESLGVPVVLHSTAAYRDVLKCLKRTGEIMNKEAEAQKVTREMEDKLAALKARIPEKKPTAIILIGSGNAFYGALPSSYVGSLVGELGAINLAQGPEDSRYRGFVAYSMERLATKDPDVIVVIRPTATSRGVPSVLPALQKDSRWQDLKAVKAKGVHEVSPALYLQMPGSRMGEALANLATLLYPEAFGNGN